VIEQPAERPNKRRTLRRVAVCIAVLLMIPIWYVTAWLSCAVAFNRGYVGVGYGNYALPLFAPLTAYANSGMYGADGLQRLYCLVLRREVLSARRSLGESITNDAFYIEFGPFSPKVKGRIFLDACEGYDGEANTSSPSTP
jgi:hypothetical protein